mgnify:CR=1 FL=1
MVTEPTLTGQVAWVTGGGSGIGLAGAMDLARAGARVVISGRDAAKLDEAIAVAIQRGVPADRLQAMPLDVADAASVSRVAQAIEAQHGAIDILVNRQSPASIPIETLKRFSLIVNMDVARNLGGVYPPIDMLNYAEIIGTTKVGA